MKKRSAPTKSVAEWGSDSVGPGERRDVDLITSRSYSGFAIRIPVHVWRAAEPGPTVFVTAAVHGDEINGTGTIRELILHPPFELDRGALILVPVINILGFERHARYLPDRRDLNRCFPGSAQGSLARRLARVVFEEIVQRCDYGIDLHTAAVRRTNFPNVRADLKRKEVARLATAFGAEVIIDGSGPKGALRRSACVAGCPTIILEAGEVWKVEPSVVECALRGIRNVLIDLDMVSGDPVKPPFQAIIDRTRWIRADTGGFLQFHVAPGDLVDAGQPLTTTTSLLGEERNVLIAPSEAIVLGMTTLPSVAPGDPVCHLAFPRHGIADIRARVGRLSEDSLHERLRDDLASSVMVSDSDAD